jgi:hypothetical protein
MYRLKSATPLGVTVYFPISQETLSTDCVNSRSHARVRHGAALTYKVSHEVCLWDMLGNINVVESRLGVHP